MISRLLKDRERIYILPTGAGFAFAATCLVMLFVGAAYGNNLIYLLSFSLIIIGFMAMVQTHNNLKEITVESIEFRLAPEQSDGQVNIAIKNPSRFQKFTIEITTSSTGMFWPKGETVIANLGVGSVDRHSFLITTPRRGLYKIKRVALSTVYPLGLFRSWKNLGLNAEKVIYPYPEGRQAPPQNWKPSGQMGPTSTHQGGEDFLGLKEYTQADSSKKIHWKATAKLDRPLTKIFLEPSDPAPNFRLQDVHVPGIERKLSQLSRWVLDAHQQGLSYSLELGTVQIASGRGDDHFKRCMKVLAEAPSEKGSSERPSDL